jgi:hypothetical protein
MDYRAVYRKDNIMNNKQQINIDELLEATKEVGVSKEYTFVSEEEMDNMINNTNKETVTTTEISREDVVALFGEDRVAEYERNHLLGVERPLVQKITLKERIKKAAFVTGTNLRATFAQQGLPTNKWFVYSTSTIVFTMMMGTAGYGIYSTVSFGIKVLKLIAHILKEVI